MKKYRNLFYCFLLLSFSFLVFIVVYKTPENIYVSKLRDRVERDTLILALVFIFPLVFVPLCFPKKIIEFYFGFMFIGLTGYAFGNTYRNREIEIELNRSTTSTNGIVKQKIYRSGKNMRYWEFNCEFEASDKIYTTFYSRDNKNKIEEGDTLEIKFVKRNPEISKIIFPSNY